MFLIVELEDHGQDFLRFILKDQTIIRTEPFQGWLWDGRKVRQKTIRPGMLLRLSADGEKGREPITLRYPVLKVTREVTQEEAKR